jgi:DNA adenine methylase
MAKPLMPWIGGKRRLAKHLIPLFPQHSCYVEPFAGAAAIYFLKEPAKVEVINDINGDVTNLYRVVKHHLGELYNQLKWMLCSRQNWEWLQATPVETLTDIQRAARFLYLQKTAFGGKVTGQTFGTSTTSRPRFNIFSLEQDLADAHYRLAGTTVENMDWAKLIEKYDREHVLFYCDPPYWKTEGYGVDFPFEEYKKLMTLAQSIKGKMVISINDHPDIRAVFDGLSMKQVDIKYTVGGQGTAGNSKELIYTNF